MTKKKINEQDDSFNYQLLGRLEADCKYFLGMGNGSEKHLWAGNVKDQIAKMKELWNGFPKDKKPEWITMEQIEKYEKDMTAKLNESFVSRKIKKMPTLEHVANITKLNESIDGLIESGARINIDGTDIPLYLQLTYDVHGASGGSYDASVELVISADDLKKLKWEGYKGQNLPLNYEEALGMTEEEVKKTGKDMADFLLSKTKININAWNGKKFTMDDLDTWYDFYG